jgi:hypothetical protein
VNIVVLLLAMSSVKPDEIVAGGCEWKCRTKIHGKAQC